VLDRPIPQVVVSTAKLSNLIERSRTSDVDRAEPDSKGDEPVSPARYPRPTLSTEYEAPRNDPERALASIWQNMLGVEKVGIHDNFFELGGDSLLNVQVTAEARRAGVRLTPKQVFEHQTIAELASVAGKEEVRERIEL
jgi:aryl carrier-like protein